MCLSGVQVRHLCQRSPRPLVPRSCYILITDLYALEVFWPIGRSCLSSFNDRFNSNLSFVLSVHEDARSASSIIERYEKTYSIDELPELFLAFRRLYNFCPFTRIRPNQCVHGLLEIRTDAKCVVNENLFQPLRRGECKLRSVIKRNGRMINSRTSIPPSKDSIHRAVLVSLSAVWI